MSESVLLLVASEAHLPHAKALFVNAVRQGKWQGDFALLCPGDTDTSAIDGRGIEIIRSPEPHWTGLIRFRVFSPYFCKWQRLLYLDCDVLIQNDLTRACDEMAKQFPAILCDSSHHTNELTVLDDWEYCHVNHGGDIERDRPLFEQLLRKYPSIATDRVFCAAAMYFSPESVPDGTTDLLFAVNEEFKALNPGGNNQPVINAVLYSRLGKMGKDHCSWFAFDEPENRVKDDNRGSRGDEFPAIIHYWGTFAPWLVKNEGAGGHFNTRLNRVAHELYAENLAAFEQEFPIL
jgi:lipopolysaccharide biosynthesis glycosyltransferase